MRTFRCWLVLILCTASFSAFAQETNRARRSSSRTNATTTATTSGDTSEETKEPDPNSAAEEERRQTATRRTQSRLTRGPYLQLGTTNSMVVRWRTELPSASAVRYGLSATNLKTTARGNGAVTEHVVLLTNLQPATRYFYALSTNTLTGTGSNAVFVATTNSFVTPPHHGTPQRTRVWVLGDPGTRKPVQYTVRDAFQKFTDRAHVDLWMLLGDNAYTSGKDDEYQAGIFLPYREMLTRSVLWPSLGNHDGGTANSVTQSGVYYDIFTLPTLGQAGGIMSGTEAYFSFDHANVHFVCLDSHDSDRSTNGPMYRWLRADLAANRQTWLIVYWHHPPYSKGSHDTDDDKDGDSRSREMRANFGPLLEAGGADLVLCGHSHAYERSYFMDGHYGRSTNFSYGMVKDRGDGRPDGDGPYRKRSAGPAPHEGTVYLVAGSSGQASGVKGLHAAMQLALNVAGSVALDFDGPRLDVTFLDSLGVQRDNFALVKGPQKTGLGPRNFTPNPLRSVGAKIPARLRPWLDPAVASPNWSLLTNAHPAHQDALFARYQKTTNFTEKTRLTWALAAIGDGKIANAFTRMLTNKIKDRVISREEEDLRFATVRSLGLLATRFEPPLEFLKKGISADWWYFRTNWISERPQHITASTLEACVIDALGLSGRPEALDPLQKGMKKFMAFKDGEPLVVVRTYTNEFHLATNRLAQFPQLGPMGWHRHLLTKELPAHPVH